MSTRRRFLDLAAAAAVLGLAGACGVKGPLYLPEDTDSEQKKDEDEDEEKVSERASTPDDPDHG